MLRIDGNSIYEIDSMCMQTNKKEIEKYLCYEEEQINLLYKNILKKQKNVKREVYTGKGVGVAIFDTGITMHPDFKERIIGFKDIMYGKKIAYDGNGHGTHVPYPKIIEYLNILIIQ